ncbi:alpha/beta fold hydrolase [Microvirga pudoricolor]|uniref:alpha/beta fold hydrolase n=1 Tax=Microvirga pudoricolor TaxID=2778729 RepID=UPI00194FF1A1|nr:alpha/beta fold hydrolase [Microvirga pudoricolor]MBM6595810.1 alpha/beta fold hydrolase [Microvirga pudoricolor]
MAETIVMIPGLLTDERLFAPQIERLAPRWPFQVANTTLDDDLPAIAARLLRGAPERFALAGLSMGGYVALEVLRQAPGRVTRLALLDTSARADTPEATENRLRLIGLAQAGRFRDVVPSLWPKLVAPARQGDRDLQGLVLAMAESLGPEVFVRQQRAIMARPDSRDLLPSVEIPTLVLVGEEDAITPPEVAREMADRIEWSSLVMIPDCGHTSTLERPDQVAEALRLWLETE